MVGQRRSLLEHWSTFCDAHIIVRAPIKLLIFAVVLLFVLFPNPRLMVEHIRRLQDLDAMIEPNAPALTNLAEHLEANLPTGLSRRQLQKHVQAFVYEAVPYDWDWNTWGVADYVPTVGELMAMGREDCDGRAVLAASLLQRMGQDAHLATDLRHVWVVAGKDELMGPGGAKSAVSTPTGTRINWRTLSNVPRSLAFGAAVFPITRELILLITIVVLLAHPRMSPWWLVVGIILLLDGLLFLRLGVHVSPGFRGFTEQLWASWLGLIHAVVGLGWLTWAARRARWRSTDY
jgi:hypothetical protein